MFNRKVKPLRFFRPEAAPQQDAERVPVSKFIADNAAMQLRLLGRADAERHKRYRNKVANAQEQRDGQEHLDWVRVGVLVCIPQPDAEQHFSRPNKFAFLRRGPYEVVAVSGRTATLRDYIRQQAGHNPSTFTWPKYNMSPYYTMGDILPPQEEIVHFPMTEELQPVPILHAAPTPSAILWTAHLPVAQWVVPGQELHVRNFQYMVRWQDKPHSQNSLESYDSIWSSTAFQDFIQGSELIGHVPPHQHEQHHLRQVQALLQGNRHPRIEVPMADAQAQVRALRGYIPMAEGQRPNAQGVQHAAQLPPLQLDQQIRDEIELQEQPDIHFDQPVRRSSRERRRTSFGNDFVQ
jgi:hypothetical protein